MGGRLEAAAYHPAGPSELETESRQLGSLEAWPSTSLGDKGKLECGPHQNEPIKVFLSIYSG